MIEIPLRRHDGSVRAVALIDDVDASLASFRWCMVSGYAWRPTGNGGAYLHRALLGLANGDSRQGDHIDRNRLDCRRSNLRILPPAANSQNVPARGGASRYRGVTWSKQKGKWKAGAKLGGRYHHIGHFDDEDQAGAAALAWRRENMPWATD